MKAVFSDIKIIAGAFIVAFLFIFMLIGLFYLPYDPNGVDIAKKLSFFSAKHILGTDGLGRDVACRISVSLRISFFIGFTASGAGLVLGTAIGAAGGFFGGKADAVTGKFIDLLMAFPGILLALMLVAVLGNGLCNTVLALSIMNLPRFARISRSGFIKYRDSALVFAERARGASPFRIIFMHILPNIYAELLITYSLSFAVSIMNEAGLSYLGLGVEPPYASFGKMLSDAQNFIFSAPWLIIVPAVFLVLLVTGFTLISDGITSVREAHR
ncbi:ABC transporter permease [Treponema parvum]|uniref:ABC transporter permease n=1 Tax=Treponema parvum TaxID=138851 RepID=A0A975EZU7_9SPIR|nr:ABC transporter permease [Treponema parvum]QTQ11899.1 ABC transporter permease [Treponema parvum]